LKHTGQVALVADDFGLNPHVNRAILQGHEQGALTGASLMMGQAGTDEAVRMARATPSLDIGWHLHLCHSRPLTCEQWPWGDSPAAAGMRLAFSPSARRLARTEIRAQWEAFRAAGLPLRFFNTHHHLHLHPWVSKVLLETVAGTDGAWFRGGAFRRLGPGESRDAAVTRQVGNLRNGAWRRLGNPPVPDSVWGLDRLHVMDAAEVRDVIRRLPPGMHEFIFHPGAAPDDRDLRALLALGSRPVAADSRRR